MEEGDSKNEQESEDEGPKEDEGQESEDEIEEEELNWEASPQDDAWAVVRGRAGGVHAGKHPCFSQNFVATAVL